MRPSFPLACAALSLIAAPAIAQDAPTTASGREAMAILKEAVATPTVEGRGQVPVLADRIRTRLIAAGFAPAEVTFTALGETGYLAARFPGRDRKAKPILVIGHLDVVEAKPADWTRDPFVPVIENGFIYGRGVYDNKAGVAMTLAAALKLRREGWRPARDLVFAFSGDEETAMKTTQAMAQAFKDAELVLNVDAGEGELSPDNRPVVYGLQAGEKTYADYRITVTDPGGHSSRPGATNAIATMGAALGRIAAHRFAPQVSPLTKAYWLASAKGAPAETAAAMRAFAADPDNAAAAALLAAKPEYVGQVRTTCVPTTIAGGHAANALPQLVTANVNCRIFPGTPVAAIAAALGKIVADPGIAIEPLDTGSIEAPESPLRADVMAAVERAVHERAPGLTIVPSMSAGASDSMHFRARGIPAFGVSAVFIRPQDDFSHGLNERLPVATLDPGVRQMETLLRTIAR
jgi:acetylornithine deacetylase/succinyl-diaminopimelate desuccinylase-like protein